MNLGLTKEGARFVEDAIIYFLKNTKYPDLLIDLYDGINVSEILTQLSFIQQLGESENEGRRILRILDNMERDE